MRDDPVGWTPGSPRERGKQLAARAAQLRARHGARLRVPDALVLATAIPLGADRVLTTDAGWPRVGVTVELVGAP